MTFLWLYVYNLKLPLAIFTILGLAVCVTITAWSFRIRDDHDPLSLAHTNAHNRIWTSLHSAIVLSVIFILVCAVPSPTYDVRIVEKVIYREKIKLVKQQPVIKYAGVKVVKELDTYSAIYQQCVRAVTGDGRAYLSINEAAACHKTALEGSRNVRLVKVKDSFKTLFDDCNDRYNVNEEKGQEDGRIVRNQRIEVCTKMAEAGST